MNARATTFDVFLSYSLADRGSAESIRESLRQAELTVFDVSNIELGTSFADAVWKALAESEAIVAVLPSDGMPNASTSAEIGAALAWSKPIYLIRLGNGAGVIPDYLRNLAVYPASRVDDVAQAILKGQKPLTEDDHKVLREIYQQMQTPADRLMRDPVQLEAFAGEFRARSGSQLPGERLMAEVIKMRKKGLLSPPVRGRRPTKTRQSSDRRR